jgi:Putative binding domain, N-terminal
MMTTLPRIALAVLLVTASAFAYAADRTPEREATSPIAPLPFRVIDAEFSTQLNAIVAVAESPNQLHIYRPDTGALVSVNLPTVPRTVGVRPDGLFAAVGHNGLISYVDLSTPALVKSFPVSTDVLDIVLAGNGFVYAFPRADQWEGIRCVNIATEVETQHSGYSIYAGTLARLHPGGTAMYGANNGLSPSDIEKYDISNGTAVVLYDSPYHGDYAMCGNLWFSTDGLRIFTACGNIFRASTDPNLDMRYIGRFAGEPFVRWVAHTQAGSNIAVLPNHNGFWWDPQPATDHEIHYYTTDFFDYRGKITLPKFIVESQQWQSRGRWLFFNAAGTKQYIVVQADEDSGMLYDYGVTTIDCTGATVSLNPASVSAGPGSSTVQTAITGSPGCGWVATSNDSWLNTLATGVSDGTAAVTVAANPTLSERTGTVTIANATFTVTQAPLLPTNVTANGTPTSVSVAWSAPQVDHFEVWRSSGGGFTLIGTPATAAFTDTTVSPGAAYLYKIRAVVTGGGTSEFSLPDYAHTYALTDPVINTGQVIRAAHITELRAAVSSVRAAAGLPAPTFTDAALVGVEAKRVHVTELRDAIAALRTALGLPAATFSPLPGNSIIYAQTTQELRSAVQ